MSTLEDTECERICPKCSNIGANQKLEIIDTRQFLILQLVLFDSEGQKSTRQCTPLQNLELNVRDVHKKYQLECIIQHIGNTVETGHYVSYFKRNDIWYRASDADISIKATQELPTQPYICIYKQTDAVAPSIVVPLSIPIS